MVKAKPFRGFLYNRDKVPGISDLVAPPWDVVSREDEEALRSLSSFNVINLISQHSSPAEVRQIFSEWIEKGVVIRDSQSSFYCLEHTFRHAGKEYTRRGLYALLMLEDFDSGNVIPHEKVFEKYRDNRLRLIEECRTNFSPIFMLYSDPSFAVENIMPSCREIFSGHIGNEDFRFGRMPLAGVGTVEKIINEGRLVIADGHHRYTAALRYFRDNPSPSNGYVLVFLANMESPDLLILPTHRYYRQDFSFIESLGELEEAFAFSETGSADEMFSLMAGTGAENASFGIHEGGRFYLLSLKDPGFLKTHMPQDASDAWRNLDAAILDTTLKKTCAGNVESDYIFSHDRDYLLREYHRSGNRGVLFFLNPVTREDFKDICFNRELMPQKTTYFYPKVPSGLVFHRFE